MQCNAMTVDVLDILWGGTIWLCLLLNISYFKWYKNDSLLNDSRSPRVTRDKFWDLMDLFTAPLFPYIMENLFEQQGFKENQQRLRS